LPAQVDGTVRAMRQPDAEAGLKTGDGFAPAPKGTKDFVERGVRGWRIPTEYGPGRKGDLWTFFAYRRADLGVCNGLTMCDGAQKASCFSEVASLLSQNERNV
jgi:hypothetical protein